MSLDFTIPMRDVGTVGGEQSDTWDNLIAFMISSRLRSGHRRRAVIDPFATVFQDSRNRRFLGSTSTGRTPFGRWPTCFRPPRRSRPTAGVPTVRRLVAEALAGPTYDCFPVIPKLGRMLERRAARLME